MKRNSKRMIAMLMIMALAGLTACGGGSSGAGSKTETQAEQTEAAVSETETKAATEAETEQFTVDTQEESQPAKADETAAEMESEVEAETEAAAEPVKEFPVEGEYKIFAMQNEGYTVAAQEMGADAVLTISEGGTGSMSFGEDAEDISEWKAEGDTITITMSDESSATGIIKNGIIELDIYGTGDLLMFFAQEGADTSEYEMIGLDELQKIMLEDSMKVEEQDSKLYAFYSSLNEDAGLHLKYQLTVESMNSVQDYEVYGKDGELYSFRTTKVAGYEDSTITLYQEGKAYNLDPEDMTGVLVTEFSESMLEDNIMMIDNLYSGIRQRAGEADYAEETREIDGVSYTAEVFPAGEYRPEDVFCFDDDGQLVYYIQGAPVIETTIEIGEQVYKVESVDNDIDESVFDISAYEIAEQ